MASIRCFLSNGYCSGIISSLYSSPTGMPGSGKVGLSPILHELVSTLSWGLLQIFVHTVSPVQRLLQWHHIFPLLFAYGLARFGQGWTLAGFILRRVNSSWRVCTGPRILAYLLWSATIRPTSGTDIPSSTAPSYHLPHDSQSDCVHATHVS